MTYSNPTNTTLHHTPVISEDGQFFESHEAHILEKEQKRKKKAMIGLGFGVTALCFVGVIGFFSSTSINQKIFSASVIGIPAALEESQSLEQCQKEVLAVSTTEAEREAREIFCTEKFSTH